MKKYLFSILILSAMPSFAVWDITLPLGSEAKSLGDDRIREFKSDVQTSLQYEGDFPGTDTSNPRFIYTPSTGTTSLRPTGNDAPAGRLFFNLSSGTIEMSQGNGNWNALTVVGSSNVTASMLSADVAGGGIGGEGGVPLRVNVDSNSFTITNDTVTLKTGGVTSAHILDGTIASADFTTSTITISGPILATAQPSFSAYNSATDTDVTGNSATPITVDFDTEVYDTGNNFSADTFTAPITGHYLLTAGVSAKDATGGNKCEIYIVTGNRTYTQEFWPTSQVYFPITAIADMDAGDTAKIQFACTGGGLVVDILGTNASTNGVGNPTFFMGSLLPN